MIDAILAVPVLIQKKDQKIVIIVQLEVILIQKLLHVLNAQQENILKKNHLNVMIVQLVIIQIKAQVLALNV